MPTKLHIHGGAPLNGTIAVDSSKNALLPIIAATILTRGVTVLKNVPRISDIDNLLHILIALNIRPTWRDGDLVIDTTDITYNEITSATAAKIRGSIFVLGAILGRFRTASVPYPGGCAIGSRPIDLHLQGLRDLGVRVIEKNGVITCKKTNTRKEVFLDFPSVGATENLILASVLGKTRTIIHGAAREPEVVDLCNFLNAAGAAICGHGTSTITIQGVPALAGTTYTAIPDRIITGSYLIAAATCGGKVTLTNTIAAHNENLIDKLRKAGCGIHINSDKITITTGPPFTKGVPAIRGRGFLRALGTVHTAPYPGFPTDLQSQLAVLQTISRGTTHITENLFENRFRYVPELKKLGAKICVTRDKSITIKGVKSLTAAHFSVNNSSLGATQLHATDLRGGVALVIAALAAPGSSVIHNAEYIYRGHAAIERDLASLGANIIRTDD